MSEIQAYIETQTCKENTNTGNDIQNSFHRNLLKLYKTLDDAIGHLMEKLKPEHFIITSDHGAEPFKYTANVTPFLNFKGFLNFKKYVLLRKILRKINRGKLRKLMSRSMPWLGEDLKDDIDWANTKAFGHRYVSGIYINDKERFNGSVKSVKEAEIIITNICEAFNKSKEAVKHSMTAKPYRKNYKNTRFEKILPDIWIDKPDSIFFEGRGAFVETNKNYKQIEDLNAVTKDMYSGIKGRHPIFIIDKKSFAIINDDDPKDLRLVYRVVDRIFAS